jgi:hypothetical protein
LSKEEAEIIAKLYKYRKLIREGKIKLSKNSAKKMIGPDTAYQLYSLSNNKKKKK